MGIHRIQMHHHGIASCLLVHALQVHFSLHIDPGVIEAVLPGNLAEDTQALEVCDLEEDILVVVSGNLVEDGRLVVLGDK